MKRKIIWWSYAITAVVLLLFVAPALISAADTLAVIAGVVLLVFFGIWSWHLWITSLIAKSKEQLKKAKESSK